MWLVQCTPSFTCVECFVLFLWACTKRILNVYFGFCVGVSSSYVKHLQCVEEIWRPIWTRRYLKNGPEFNLQSFYGIITREILYKIWLSHRFRKMWKCGQVLQSLLALQFVNLGANQHSRGESNKTQFSIFMVFCMIFPWSYNCCKRFIVCLIVKQGFHVSSLIISIVAK